MPTSLGRASSRFRWTALTLAALCLATTACDSSTGNGSSTASSGTCKPANGPVTLDYWTWGAGYEDAAKLWNSKHPDIQVRFSSIPVGSDGGYQKMFNAAKAGTAPDVGFLEFDNVPAFRSQDALADLGACLGQDKVSDFVPKVWEQVTLGEPHSAYGVPIGSGPMALFYRKDLFTAHGITAPTTWQEFASAAAKIKQVDPQAYITNFAANTPNWFAGLAAQNSAQWFSLSGANWHVTVNDAASKQVADYWRGLVDAKQVTVMNTFSPEWNAAVASGHLWTWVTAVWGAGIIKTSAPGTSGDWAVAPMPTWGAGKPGSANWGGGGLSVFKSSKHPYEAAQFALWMGTDPEALQILNKAIGIYPTTNTLLKNPLLEQPDPFFGNQKIFDVFRDASSNLPSFQWGPTMSDTYAAIGDGFSAVLGDPTKKLPDALDSAQQHTVDTMKKQGMKVG